MFGVIHLFVWCLIFVLIEKKRKCESGMRGSGGISALGKWGLFSRASPPFQWKSASKVLR